MDVSSKDHEVIWPDYSQSKNKNPDNIQTLDFSGLIGLKEGSRTLRKKSLSSEMCTSSHNRDIIVRSNPDKSPLCKPVRQKRINLFKKIVKNGSEDFSQKEFFENFSSRLTRLAGEKGIRDFAVASRNGSFQCAWMKLCLQLNPQRGEKFLNDLIYQAIRMSDDEKTLLRADNDYKFILAQYIQNELRPLIIKILKCLKPYSKYTVCSKSHPEKENDKKLNQLTRKVLNIMLEYVQLDFPESLYQIFKIAITKTEEKFFSDGIGMRSIQSLLFLLGISPLLTIPPSSKVYQQLWDETKHEHRLFLSQLIQKMANNTTFEVVNSMQRFNLVIHQNQETMDKVLDAVYKKAKLHSRKVRAIVTEDLLAHIHTFLTYINDNRTNLIIRSRSYRLFSSTWLSYQGLSEVKKIKNCDILSAVHVKEEPFLSESEMKSRLLHVNLWNWRPIDIASRLKWHPIDSDFMNFLLYHEYSGMHLIWIFTGSLLFSENEIKRVGETIRLKNELAQCQQKLDEEEAKEFKDQLIKQLALFLKLILSEKEIKNWNRWDAALWLYLLNLESCVPRSLEYRVDGPSLLSLYQDRGSFSEIFKKLGINDASDQKKFKKSFRQLIADS